VIHRIGTTPILLVMAHRPEEDAALYPLIEAAAGVGATELNLGPLTAPDLDGMTRRAEEVIVQTGGIPALVSESLRTGEVGEPTPGIRRYINACLAGLDSLAMQVLSTAAVLSGTCDLDVLRVTSGRSDDEVVNAVETLMRRGVMRANSEGGLEFSFANMESLVYEDITPVRRRVLH